MKSLRLGIIGVCRRGRLADLAHQPENGVTIVAGTDIFETQLESFKQRYSEKFNCQVNTYQDYREMLQREQLDGVFITSPDYCHEEQAVAVLDAGVGVFLEKPMAITISGCDHILATAAKRHARLFIGHNMRHFQSIIKMKELINAGVIGDIQSIWCRHFVAYGGDAYFRDWHSERRFSNGLLVHKGAHDIDVIHWLTNSFTERVVGMGMLSVYDKCKRRKPLEKCDPSWDINHWPPSELSGMSPVIDVEDHNMIMMQLANGVQAAYMQCHYAPVSWRNYTCLGSCGRMENIGDAGEAEIHVWNTRKCGQKPDIIYSLEAREGSHGGADQDIVNSFIAFLKEGTPPAISPVAARNAVAVGVMGHESMRNMNEVKTILPVATELEKYFANGQQ